MSLQTRLASLITAIGADVKALRTTEASLELVQFAAAGTLTTGVGGFRFPVKGGTFQIVSVAAMVDTAPTGASVIIDVNKNTSSIYGTQGNRPTIAASAFAATVGAHTATTVTDGDYLKVDIDQIGSTIAGANLVVAIRLQRIS